MPAYIIARVNVTDPEKYKGYQALTPNAIAKNGGKFIVRGGAISTLEGPEENSRVVVLEFEDAAAAKAFYDSPEYLEAREARAGAADFQMFVVEGV